VGLIQGVLEHAGIATVSITVLAEVTRAVRPPRALFVDAPLGYPLVAPFDAPRQREVVEAALALLDRQDVPFIAHFERKDAASGAPRGTFALDVLETRGEP
jgi:D-proline reductase (dithiol) PrdB